MKKDYDTWNVQKKKLEIEKFDNLSFHEGDIWWCSLGANLGEEEDGKNASFERPVLVLRRFNKKIAWVIPMTSKGKSNRYYFMSQNAQDYFVLSQLRLVSVKRFSRFMRKISSYDFFIITEKIMGLMLYRP